MDLGWKPKEPLDLFSSPKSNVEPQEEMNKLLLEASTRDAQYAYKVSSSRQASYAARRMKEPTCEVGDQVWLKMALFMDSVSGIREVEGSQIWAA